MAGNVRILRPRRKARRRALWLLAVFLLALLAYGVLKGPYFRLQHVQVVGGPATLFKATGVTYGTPLFLINTVRAAHRLEKADPWVNQVKISRVLPATLLISVVHRQPVAVVASPQGTVFGLDPTGMLLPADQKEATAYPFVSGFSVPDKPFATVATPAAKLALNVLSALGPLTAQTSELMVHQGGLTLYLRHGPEVLLGDDTQLPKKLEVLHAIEQQLKASGKSAWKIDVQDPSHPAVGLQP